MEAARVHYLSPLFGLAEGAFWKIAASAAFVFVSELMARMFAVSVDFLALMVLLVIGDTITGMLAAKRREEPITSKAMRRTITKASEYFVFVLLAVGISNVIGGAEIPFVSVTVEHLGPLTAAYVCLTELRSIAENVGMGDWMQRIQDIIDAIK